MKNLPLLSCFLSFVFLSFSATNYCTSWHFHRITESFLTTIVFRGNVCCQIIFQFFYLLLIFTPVFSFLCFPLPLPYLHWLLSYTIFYFVWFLKHFISFYISFNLSFLSSLVHHLVYIFLGDIIVVFFVRVVVLVAAGGTWLNGIAWEESKAMVSKNICERGRYEAK